MGLYEILNQAYRGISEELKIAKDSFIELRKRFEKYISPSQDLEFALATTNGMRVGKPNRVIPIRYEMSADDSNNIDSSGDLEEIIVPQEIPASVQTPPSALPAVPKVRTVAQLIREYTKVKSDIDLAYHNFNTLLKNEESVDSYVGMKKLTREILSANEKLNVIYNDLNSESIRKTLGTDTDFIKNVSADRNRNVDALYIASYYLKENMKFQEKGDNNELILGKIGEEEESKAKLMFDLIRNNDSTIENVIEEDGEYIKKLMDIKRRFAETFRRYESEFPKAPEGGAGDTRMGANNEMYVNEWKTLEQDLDQIYLNGNHRTRLSRELRTAVQREIISMYTITNFAIDDLSGNIKINGERMVAKRNNEELPNTLENRSFYYTELIRVDKRTKNNRTNAEIIRSYYEGNSSKDIEKEAIGMLINQGVVFFNSLPTGGNLFHPNVVDDYKIQIDLAEKLAIINPKPQEISDEQIGESASTMDDNTPIPEVKRHTQKQVLEPKEEEKVPKGIIGKTTAILMNKYREYKDKRSKK